MAIPSGISSAMATTIFEHWGVTTTNSASTYTSPALASTNLLSSIRRSRLTTTTTAGALGYSYIANTSSRLAWRGNASGLGGFYYTTRFGFSTLQSGNRAFIGLDSATAAPTNVDPTTSTTSDKLGVAINSNTGNLQWVNNVSGTAPTVTDLGTNFPVNTTNLYELIIFSPPNGSSITYRVKNLSTNTATSDTTVSTNILANTTFIAPSLWATNNATAAAVSIDSGGWYLESDD